MAVTIKGIVDSLIRFDVSGTPTQIGLTELFTFELTWESTLVTSRAMNASGDQVIISSCPGGKQATLNIQSESGSWGMLQIALGHLSATNTNEYFYSETQTYTAPNNTLSKTPTDDALRLATDYENPDTNYAVTGTGVTATLPAGAEGRLVTFSYPVAAGAENAIVYGSDLANQIGKVTFAGRFLSCGATRRVEVRKGQIVPAGSMQVGNNQVATFNPTIQCEQDERGNLFTIFDA